MPFHHFKQSPWRFYSVTYRVYFSSYISNLFTYSTYFAAKDETYDVLAIKDGVAIKNVVYTNFDDSNKKPNFKFKKQPDDVKTICAIYTKSKDDFDFKYTFFKVAANTVKTHIESGEAYFPMDDLDIWNNGCQRNG